MDIEKTKAYYDSLSSGDLCTCDYCRNYYKEIKSAYPTLAEYLRKMGVDIEKPLETMPLEPEADGTILYTAVQYVVMGRPLRFHRSAVSGVRIGIAKSHPMTNVSDEHFVMELWPIRLRWTM